MKIDFNRLLNYLMPFNWQKSCDIVEEDGRILIVYRRTEEETTRNYPSMDSYLRHSCGPKQGYFWDVYGDDMKNPEVAILALSQAPPPTSWKKPIYEDIVGEVKFANKFKFNPTPIV